MVLTEERRLEEWNEGSAAEGRREEKDKKEAPDERLRGIALTY